MKKIFFIIATLISSIKSEAQNFIFYEDSISIYGHKMKRLESKEDKEKAFLIKNICNIIPSEYKKVKLSRLFYQIRYVSLGFAFETSNKINNPFDNTQLHMMKFVYNQENVTNPSYLSVCGHIITDTMNFDKFIKDDFWKQFADSSFYEEYKSNDVIYVSSNFCNNSLLFVFNNAPPYKIHSVKLNL